MALWIVLGVIALIIIMFVSLYNRIVKLANNRENAFSNIDVQLRLRHELVPNLVETVKGYAHHESDVLLRVTEARAAAMQARTTDQKVEAENRLSQALADLKVSVEQYPDLKANQNFLQLQNELADIENKIAAVRRYFNSATREYNNSVMTFPANLIAGMCGYHKEPMLEFPEQLRQAIDTPPSVKF